MRSIIKDTRMRGSVLNNITSTPSCFAWHLKLIGLHICRVPIYYYRAYLILTRRQTLAHLFERLQAYSAQCQITMPTTMFLNFHANEGPLLRNIVQYIILSTYTFKMNSEMIHYIQTKLWYTRLHVCELGYFVLTSAFHPSTIITPFRAFRSLSSLGI